MKNKKMIAFIGAAAIAVGLSAGLIIGKEALTKSREEKIGSLPDGFTVTAHSGSMGTVQNSPDSLEVGAKNADIIEFDLNFNEKNEPVLSHDAPTGGEPTLKEAFEILAKHKTAKANVDLKSAANLPEVQRLAEECGVLSQIFFTGVGEDRIEIVKRDCPKIPYYLNYGIDKKQNKDSAYIQSIVAKVKETGSIGLNFRFDGASKELIDALDKNGLLVSVWTVNGKGKMYKMLSLGVDNITTERPDKLNKIVSAYRNE